MDSRTLQSTPESGPRAGWDGAKRTQETKVHLAVDTLGQLLAVHDTPANAQDHDQVSELADAVQTATGQTVTVAYVDQGYTGKRPRQAVADQGIDLLVVKLPQTKRGSVLDLCPRAHRGQLRPDRLCAQGSGPCANTVAGNETDCLSLTQPLCHDCASDADCSAISGAVCVDAYLGVCPSGVTTMCAQAL